MDPRRVVVLDNGGFTVKLGLADQAEPWEFPNATGKVKGERGTLVGQQLLGCKDVSALSGNHRPIDRGYVVNWDLEKAIWDTGFKGLSSTLLADAGLVLTEPCFALPAIQAATDQVIFEEYGFASYAPAPAPALAVRPFSQQHPALPAGRALCGLVVDAGFSFTHVAAVFDGRVLRSGVRRINLGGKALTNYLKELISYRSINMMEETFLVDLIKEAACFVSTDLQADLAAARKGRHRREYVLPDGIDNLRGYLREPLAARAIEAQGKEAPVPSKTQRDKEQVVTLNNERFMVPELVFNPSDIGLDQAGLAQCVADAAQGVHSDLRPLLFSNVLCTGGMARCPGFAARLAADLRPLVPTDIEVGVHMAEQPALAAWQGGRLLAASAEYTHVAISRAEYEEQGSAHSRNAGQRRL